MDGAVLQILANAVILTSIYSVIGLGLNLIYSTTRLLDIAHGDFIMIGGYSAYWLFTLFGLDPLMSLPFTAALTGLIGFVMYRFLFRYVVRTSPSSEIVESRSLLIFFGLFIAVESTAAILWTSRMRGYSYLPNVVSFFNVTMLLNQVLSTVIGISIIVCIYWLLHRTWAGRGIRLVIQDRVAAGVVGVNDDRTNVYSFTLGFVLAGVSGSLISYTAVMTPFIGLPYTMIGFIVIIIGGIGSLPGTIIGAAALALSETIGVYFTSPSLRTIILYFLFVILVLVRPKGIIARK